MRKTIYRGKSIEFGEWVEGDYYRRLKNLKDNSYTEMIKPLGLEAEEVIPETIGQYWREINDHPYFEGDIFSITGSYGFKIYKLVGWNDTGFRVANIEDLNRDYLDADSVWQCCSNNWIDKVKDRLTYEGNKFDNINLLKVVK